VIERFKSCRSLITIDGTHVYEMFDGKLLIIIDFNTNNRTFSLVFSLVEEEINYNWRWFYFACSDILLMTISIYV